MLCINIAFQILKFNWMTFFHIHEKMHIFSISMFLFAVTLWPKPKCGVDKFASAQRGTV